MSFGSAMNNLMINIGSEFTGAKAFAKAEKATDKLARNVKSLGKGLGLALGARQLGRYAKDAVQSFAADDKAVKTLTKSLYNLGLGFQAPQVNKFIASLEKTYGVVDDLLRPAFQKLLTTTGSVAESQKMLMTALDLSAASGLDVQSVSDDLSKAYVGQTRALAKYGLGLSQAELKAMSFAEVQDKINSIFGGQAALNVETYAGKLDLLTVAGDNAKETIGKGLVDAFAALGGSGGMPATVKLIENASTAIADLTVGIARTGKYLVTWLGNMKEANALAAEWKQQDLLGRFGGTSIEGIRANAMAEYYGAKKVAVVKEKSNKSNLKAASALAKQNKEAATLTKTAAMFDLEKIQILAALKGDITNEERKRLELQLAITTGNASEASKLTYELARSQGLTAELAKNLADLPDAKNPFASWGAYLDTLEAQAKRIALMGTNAPSMGTGAFAGLDMTQVGAAGIPQFQIDRLLNGVGGGAPASGGVPDIKVYIGDAEILARITVGQQNQSLSGTQSYIDRKLGGW